jgi:hypothetical protein
MVKPFIYMSTWKIKEGRLEVYKKFAKEFMEHIKAKRAPTNRLQFLLQ